MFSARRGTLSKRPIGRDYLLDSLRDLYLMAGRFLCNFIMIASMNYFPASCPNWESIISYSGDTNNSFLNNDRNDLACLS